jgi:predicted nucleotidyltransferase
MSTVLDYRTLNQTLKTLALRYTQLLEQELGERLVSVALFGSVARGTANEYSDIDLFVVIKDLPTGAFARREVVEPVHQALLPELNKLLLSGIYVDLIELLRTPTEADRFHMLYLDMMLEAQLLYDRNGFMGRRLDHVRQRANELGATRRQAGEEWYWDLKPDFVPGEVIVL